MTPVYTSAFAQDLLTQIKNAVDGILLGAKLHLFVNDVSPQKSSVVADFTEASFTDYAVHDVTWSADPLTDGSEWKIISDLASFVAGAAPTPETVYGWYLTDSAGTGLIAAKRYDDPVQITQEFDSVQAVVEMAC